jgi:hypothetical protein
MKFEHCHHCQMQKQLKEQHFQQLAPLDEEMLSNVLKRAETRGLNQCSLLKFTPCTDISTSMKPHNGSLVLPLRLYHMSSTKSQLPAHTRSFCHAKAKRKAQKKNSSQCGHESEETKKMIRTAGLLSGGQKPDLCKLDLAVMRMEGSSSEQRFGGMGEGRRRIAVQGAAFEVDQHISTTSRFFIFSASSASPASFPCFPCFQ